MLTRDPAILRRQARAMLATVLSCKADASGSGSMARHAGADAWLPNMATEAFLGCLSKAALNETALANDVARFDRAKDTRAALWRAFRERTYVHPAARFALSADEIEAERRWSVPGPSELEPEVAVDGGNARAGTPAAEMTDDNAGGLETDKDEENPIAA